MTLQSSDTIGADSSSSRSYGGIYWGSDAVLPLAYVEVRPATLCSHGSVCCCCCCCCSVPALTAAFVKLQLMRATCRSALLGGDKHVIQLQQQQLHSSSMIRIQLCDATTTTNKGSNNESSCSTTILTGGSLVAVRRRKKAKEDNEEEVDEEELLCFPTNDPACPELWPCECQGFALSMNATAAASHVQQQIHRTEKRRCAVLVTEATLVHVLPRRTSASDCSCCCSSPNNSATWKDQLTGEVTVSIHREQQRAVLATQNPTNIKELALRMKRLLSEPVHIGTTADALEQRRRRKAARLCRERAIRAVLGSRAGGTSLTVDIQTSEQIDVSDKTSASLFRDGALLVHSPEHGAGKTALVETIAHCFLGAAVHVIRPGPMLAKYGIHADTALQCTIHAVVMQAAVRQHQPVCIVLDDLDAMLPIRSSSTSSKSSTAAGDAANPVLHGIASYLQTLTTSLQQRRELPFPRGNPLYNLNGTNGVILPVRLCLVAVVTCPDDGWKLAGNAVTAAMGAYRLPNLTSGTRLAAFRWAMSEERMKLSSELEQRLPFLAASATWARGALFQRVARRIRARVESRHSALPNPEYVRDPSVVTFEDAELEFAVSSSSVTSGCDVQFLAEGGDKSESLFSVVGGNQEAKAALEDALALDPVRRTLLASFGLSPGTGILLYGPPGTGE